MLVGWRFRLPCTLDHRHANQHVGTVLVVCDWWTLGSNVDAPDLHTKYLHLPVGMLTGKMCCINLPRQTGGLHLEALNV